MFCANFPPHAGAEPCSFSCRMQGRAGPCSFSRRMQGRAGPCPLSRRMQGRDLAHYPAACRGDPAHYPAACRGGRDLVHFPAACRCGTLPISAAKQRPLAKNTAWKSKFEIQAVFRTASPAVCRGGTLLIIPPHAGAGPCSLSHRRQAVGHCISMRSRRCRKAEEGNWPHPSLRRKGGGGNRGCGGLLTAMLSLRDTR